MRGRGLGFYLNALMIFLVLLNIGCSENLTNEKAKKIIISETKYPLKKIGSFEISQSPDQGVMIAKDKMPDYIKMMANKLILLNIRSVSRDGSEYYDVKLTDEGNKFVLHKKEVEGKSIIEVLLGEIIFDKIISIRKDPNKDVYKVTYLEEIGRITPFGTCLINQPTYEKTISLVLHNGKWQKD